MLPNLLTIGAMKAGTTSLHYYLSLHPEIYMSEDKEPTFFTVEKNWSRGVSWYASLFPTDAKIRGESSPDYTKYPAIAGVPARIRSVVPDARLIYLVRDPIDRIVSHYVDAYSFGRVHQPINRELARFEKHHFVNCSRYHMQLEQYLGHFDPGRVLVVATEELRLARRETMRNIFRFLGVDESFSTQAFDEMLYTADEKRRKTRLGYALVAGAERFRRSRLRRYVSPRLLRPVAAFNALTARPIDRPTLDPSLRSELADYLRPDADRLRAFAGDPFPAWSV